MPEFVGDVFEGVGDVIGGVADVAGDVLDVVAPIASFIPGPWQLPAMAYNGLNSLANGDILGTIGSAFGIQSLGGFGGLTGFQGAAGGVMNASQIDDVIGAYTSAGFGPDDIAQFIGEASGNPGMSFKTISDIAKGGGTLNMAGQGLVGYSGGFGGAVNSIFGNPGGSVGNTTLPDAGGVFGNNNAGMGTAGSTFGMPNSKIKNIFEAGQSIYQAFNQPNVQAPRVAQAGADPYAPYRPAAAAELNALIQNPNRVYGMPGYQFAQQQGQKQIERSAASTGNLASGNTLNALQQQGASTAQSWYDNYVKNLSVLSGAANSPASGQEAYNMAQQAQAQAEKSRQQNLLMGIQGLATSFFS
jgi:hypothetical protein